MLRRFRTLFVALAAVSVLGLSLTTLSRAQVSAAPSEAPAAQGRGESSCVAVNRKDASPKVILLGETVDITLTITALCAGEQFPLHIVLVLDGSGSMAGDPNREMKKAARNLVQRLGLKDSPATQIGVVQFNSAAKILCQLTNSSGKASGCIGRVGAVGGTNIGEGINAGLRVLQKGRQGASDPDSINEIMVVLSDGEDNQGCGNVQAAAGRVKAQGILLITVCVGTSCDAQCMRQVASSPRYFFEARSASQLSNIFEQIRRGIDRIVLKSLKVVDNLPPNMVLVEGSAEPVPNSTGPNDDQLEWRTSYVPREGVTYSFKVKPQEVGHWPTNNGAFGEFTDNKSRKGTFEFRDPYVLVLNPRPLATATAPPPPLTPTPPPTEGPPPTPTPTPTNTPTPKPGPIYLPIMVTERCYVDEKLIDVVFVIDMSTSMDRTTPDGIEKKVAVIDSAKAFVDRLDFSPNDKGQHDQAGVVWFNDEAGIAQSLTNDRDDVIGALDSLTQYQQQGTRIDKAFEMGALALDPSMRKPRNTAVMIMLTDGLPNRVPFDEETGRMEETVIKAAKAAAATEIRIYTVGFGKTPEQTNDITELVYPWLLKQCATPDGRSFVAPRADELAEIYEEIADVFRCPKGRHDWGSPWPPERGRTAPSP